MHKRFKTAKVFTAPIKSEGECAPSYCSMCGRPLNIESDGLSIDCGGDCWGCVGECEYDGPNGETEWNKQVYDDIRDGLRNSQSKSLGRIE